MKNGTINCTVNGTTGSQTYTPDIWTLTDAYYFKAGNYLQYNPHIVPDPTVIYGQNQFYKLSLVKQVTEFQTISETNKFNIYPNPTKDKMSVSCSGSITSGFHFQIFDSTGKLMKIQNYTENMTVDVSDLPNGIYLTKISNNLNSIITKFRISK